MLKTPKRRESLEIFTQPPYRLGYDHDCAALLSVLSFRFRRRASLELELVALRHQLAVLRRQRPGRLRILATDRLLWMWLYRIWPQALNAMVLVKPVRRRRPFYPYSPPPRPHDRRRRWSTCPKFLPCSRALQN